MRRVQSLAESYRTAHYLAATFGQLTARTAKGCNLKTFVAMPICLGKSAPRFLFRRLELIDSGPSGGLGVQFVWSVDCFAPG
jgi:hypothetical protein